MFVEQPAGLGGSDAARRRHRRRLQLRHGLDRGRRRAACAICGVGFLLAETINGLFFRNAVNFGLLALRMPAACPPPSRRATRRNSTSTTWSVRNPRTGQDADGVAGAAAAAGDDAGRWHLSDAGARGPDRSPVSLLERRHTTMKIVVFGPDKRVGALRGEAGRRPVARLREIPEGAPGRAATDRCWHPRLVPSDLAALHRRWRAHPRACRSCARSSVR